MSQFLFDQLSRRNFLTATASMLGVSASGWLPAFAEQVSNDPQRRRQCILLWMAGGPSQMDTFDLKPDHENGGEFKEIATNVPGVRISEHLPKLAKHADKLAIVRSLSTREGDHARGTQLMRTGKAPGGPVAYPSIGSSLSKQLDYEQNNLPSYISIGSNASFAPAAFGPGFLGPSYAPTPVGVTRSGDEETYPRLGVNHLRAPEGIAADQNAIRRQLWNTLQDDFLATHKVGNAIAHDTAYRRAMRMMDSNAAEAFELDKESDAVREAYGTSLFGQGCLLARRLIERGVPFVEVGLGAAGDNIGWDTHANNFDSVKTLSEQLDAGWGTLMAELAERGLLETTTILWMGEFGRTPTINSNGGRDHFPQAWTCVFGGGGIAGGQAYGKTSDSGAEVVDKKADVGNVLATLCSALGVDPDHENLTPKNRPIKIVEGGAIDELLS